MRGIFDYFRNRDAKGGHDAPVGEQEVRLQTNEPHPVAPPPPERTSARAEKLVRLKRKAHRKHMRRNHHGKAST